VAERVTAAHELRLVDIFQPDPSNVVGLPHELEERGFIERRRAAEGHLRVGEVLRARHHDAVRAGGRVH
jgi:DNA-binding PadR family transcriptional regulator